MKKIAEARGALVGQLSACLQHRRLAFGCVWLRQCISTLQKANPKLVQFETPIVIKSIHKNLKSDLDGTKGFGFVRWRFGEVFVETDSSEAPPPSLNAAASFLVAHEHLRLPHSHFFARFLVLERSSDLDGINQSAQ